MTLRELAADLVEHVSADLEVWHARTLNGWQRDHLIVLIERKLRELIYSGDCTTAILQALHVGTGQCADPRCRCHTDPAHQVTTPFPLEAGPPYCCNRCARRPLGAIAR